ncbi:MULTISPECIES: SE1561 family protein [Sediminibacillus]|nr:SE1561 family protein [Sediminibacillus terrae]
MANQDKIEQLKVHLAGFMTRLENMDPEETSIEDIDQLISILDKMETSLK